MIVVMVYRPEAADNAGDNDRFDGIEVYGSYYEMEKDEVTTMVNKLMDEHPGWQFQIEPGVKNYIGLKTW